ncbi:large ribosomal subunit protein uL18-like [Musa acuminata AAA Group]|uniref:large ribosomal subunit protein uL18-like n=1 Tax=Musa acuminata AAA Group TaxID=214697 RepID=UPI0031D8EC5D
MNFHATDSKLVLPTMLQATGEDFSVEPAESRRPFRALLDVGLVRTTTGNRVFGALKGALDGGLDIPRSDKRFAGFKKDEKQLDAEVQELHLWRSCCVLREGR